MSGNPRTVAVETWFTWDGNPQRLAKGQVIDVPPGSALERAIGPGNLVPVPGAPLPPPVEAVEPAEAPPRPASGRHRAPARKQGSTRGASS